jgi:hypothetical protein
MQRSEAESTWRESGLGWSDDDGRGSGPWPVAEVLVPLLALAGYWAAIWLARGLPPFGYLLLRAQDPASWGRRRSRA